ncbi:MAG TPA: GntR family transcriptional regulator [Thermoanaerobaculia bacterium]|nr:GntR family transcriptional regulator [Thermoanaerobaculia bacterium]
MFDIDTSGVAPIWKQIEEGMRRMISLGVLRPGEAVPSVRDLARMLRVNPNTVARAYQRLTEGGVFAVRRGEGTFVAHDPVQMKRSERQEALHDAAARYARTAMAVGASRDEATEALAASYQRVVRELRRKA